MLVMGMLKVMMLMVTVTGNYAVKTEEPTKRNWMVGRQDDDDDVDVVLGTTMVMMLTASVLSQSLVVLLRMCLCVSVCKMQGKGVLES